MYNRSSDLEHFDDARMASLFCHSNKSMENLPPNLTTLQTSYNNQASVWNTYKQIEQQT